MSKKNIAFISAPLVLGGILAVWHFADNSSHDQSTGIQAPIVETEAAKSTTPPRTPDAVSTGGDTEHAHHHDDDDDDVTLSAEEQMILNGLLKGVQNENLSLVHDAVRKLGNKLKTEGVGSVPKSLRLQAIEALGEFPRLALSSLPAFLSDSDSEVRHEAVDQFESAAESAGIGDRRLADHLVTAASILSDDEALDAVFSLVEGKLRHSVAVKTYSRILEEGSAAAKKRVWESVEEFTGEDNVKDMAALNAWFRENPDDDDDDEFFGPEKD